MKTHTASAVRQNLSAYLRRALKGEDIGIVCDGKIVALRPVQVFSEDYALMEYGVTEEQLDRVVAKLDRQARSKKGRKTWDGTLKGLRG